MSHTSNPGSATPQSLHKLYSSQAAATANPYTLRQFSTPAVFNDAHTKSLNLHGLMSPRQLGGATPQISTKRGDPPTRASFKCVAFGPSHPPTTVRR